MLVVPLALHKQLVTLNKVMDALDLIVKRLDASYGSTGDEESVFNIHLSFSLSTIGARR